MARSMPWEKVTPSGSVSPVEVGTAASAAVSPPRPANTHHRCQETNPKRPAKESRHESIRRISPQGTRKRNGNQTRNSSHDEEVSKGMIWKNKRVQHFVECRIGSKTTVAKSSLDKIGYVVGWERDDSYDLALDKGLWLVERHQ
ncbi:uncharacterized protein PAC_17025 [Phialocephala subalpina]|uniref:Uncharacterized protein n=1 Tax=Phialocephala subalpina TaxID=576137 RepID=A0A1L7XQ07_9HELO|nr:uncharacterized protein PAC_17025 [Phialocephala subalpina]